MAGELFMSGLTGQFDAAGFVERIMQMKSIPLQKINQEIALSQAKASSLANFAGAVNDFLSLFDNLNVDDLFKGKKATSSDKDVLPATATQDAPNISFNVTVNSLAQTEIRVSNGGFNSLNDTFASSGSFTLRFNKSSTTYEEFTIDYNTGETLEDLVNRINSAQDYVKASVYFDGSTYKLMLSEKRPEDSDIETDTTTNTYAIEIVGSLPTELGTGLDTLQNAKNASITIGNGSPITSPSNTFQDVISGLSITVKSTGTATVTVEDDNSPITKFFKDFVEKYNGVVAMVNQLTDINEGVFIGDNTIKTVKSNLANFLNLLINEDLVDYNSNTGEISLKTENLNNLITNDKDKVRNLINNMKDVFGKYLEREKRSIDVYKSYFDDRIRSLEERARELAERLTKEEELLRYQFSKIESFIAEMNDIRQRLQQFTVTLSQMAGGEKK